VRKTEVLPATSKAAVGPETKFFTHATGVNGLSVFTAAVGASVNRSDAATGEELTETGDGLKVVLKSDETGARISVAWEADIPRASRGVAEEIPIGFVAG